MYYRSSMYDLCCNNKTCLPSLQTFERLIQVWLLSPDMNASDCFEKIIFQLPLSVRMTCNISPSFVHWYLVSVASFEFCQNQQFGIPSMSFFISYITAGNRHKQNSWFCKEIREDNFRFWWRRVHVDAS